MYYTSSPGPSSIFQLFKIIIGYGVHVDPTHEPHRSLIILKSEKMGEEMNHISYNYRQT
jgi:hypothetical protein